MKETEKQKFNKFYRFMALAWIFFILVYAISRFLIIPSLSDDKTLNFFEAVTDIIRVFGVFFIPIIVLISIPIRFAENLLDRYLQYKDRNK